MRKDNALARFFADLRVRAALPGGMALLAALAMLIYTAVMSAVWANRIAELDTSVMDEINETAVQVRQNRVTLNDVYSLIVEIDYARKERDDRIAADILRYATTWSSSAEYDASRAALLKKYPDFEETSMLLSSFFPPSEQLIIRDSSGAIVKNELDDGRNIAFVSLDAHVIGIRDDVYQYFGEITTQSKGENGGTATGRIVTTYDVDADGAVSDMKLFVARRQ